MDLNHIYRLPRSKYDKDFIETIKSMETIVFGDNRTDQDTIVDQYLYARRIAFLRRVRDDIDHHSEEEYLVLRKDGLISRLKNVFSVFRSARKSINIVNEIKEFAKAVSAARQDKKYNYYYGECSICKVDLADKDKPIIILCCHVYHEACLKRWFNGQTVGSGPICRMTLDSRDDGSLIHLVDDT